MRTRLLSLAAAVVQAISVGAQPSQQEEPLFPITKNGRDGYIDRTGKIRIAPQFASAARFSEGLAAVSVAPHFKEGYINPKGEWVIEPQFGGAGEFSEGLATVHLEVNLMSPTVVIDRNGQIVFRETTVQSAGGRFFEGLKAVGDGTGKWGYIDKTGKIVIETQFDQPGDFSDGIARVEINERAQYIDKTGAVAFTLPYEYSGDLREGLIPVCTGEKKCGYADRSGKLVIAPRFDQVENFSEGLAAVAINGRWGVINRSGKFAVRPRFKSLHRQQSPLEEFSGGLARDDSVGSGAAREDGLYRPDRQIRVAANELSAIQRPNQAMQLTASKPAVYILRVCHPPAGCEQRFTGLAAADLVSR